MINTNVSSHNGNHITVVRHRRMQNGSEGLAEAEPPQRELRAAVAAQRHDVHVPQDKPTIQEFA